jgi:hypothetical protein
MTLPPKSMPQITAYLSSLNALPGSSVALHVDASDDAGKLTLSCFHSMETSNCLLSLPITSPASQIPIPEDWEAGMYKLIVKGSDDAKWEGILVVRPQDVDVRTISGARAPPAAHRQVVIHRDLTTSLAFRVHSYASVSFPSFSIMYAGHEYPKVRYAINLVTRLLFVDFSPDQLPAPDAPSLDTATPATPHSLHLAFETLDNPSIRRYRLMARNDASSASCASAALGCLPNGEPAGAFRELAIFECSAKYRAGKTRVYRHAAEGLEAGREYGFLVLAEADHATSCRS